MGAVCIAALLLNAAVQIPKGELEVRLGADPGYVNLATD